MKKHWLILHVSILLTCSCVLADTHYVVKDNPGASSPYLTWATAAANIQDAIDVTGVGDTVLASNSTDWEGAGLFLPVYVQDCLIQGNRGRYGSGGYGNSPADFRAGTYSMSYSCAVTNIGTFQGGTAVVTNDPMFVDEANGNYRLKKAGSNPNGWSPCIDSGLNEAWMIGATDLDGNPRILPVGGTVDMGCYEYVPPPPGTMFVGW